MPARPWNECLRISLSSGKYGDFMNKRTMILIALCLIALAAFIFANLPGAAKNKHTGGPDMELLTKEEFIKYLETNDTGCTLVDFEDIDIDDFIQRLELTADFIKMVKMSSLIQTYEFDIIYPNYTLFTTEEFFEFLAIHDTGLSAEDFKYIDVADFIERYRITKIPKIRNYASIKSDLESYKIWLEYQTAENYNYLFTAEYETLKEVDIPDIERLYLSAWIGDADKGKFGHWFIRIFDFAEQKYKAPSSGYGGQNDGIYILSFTPVHDLPYSAIEHIKGLLTEYDIVNMEQTEFPEKIKADGNWHLCMEIADGRVIRYSGVGDPPPQFFRLARALYSYVINYLK